MAVSIFQKVCQLQNPKNQENAVCKATDLPAA